MTVLVDEQKLVDQFADLARKVRAMVRMETIEECAKVADAAANTLKSPYGVEPFARAKLFNVAGTIRALASNGNSDV